MLVIEILTMFSTFVWYNGFYLKVNSPLVVLTVRLLLSISPQVTFVSDIRK